MLVANKLSTLGRHEFQASTFTFGILSYRFFEVEENIFFAPSIKLLENAVCALSWSLPEISIDSTSPSQINAEEIDPLLLSHASLEER